MSKTRIVGLVTSVIIAITALIYVLTSCVKIKPGYVGVVYNMNGGVQQELLTQGVHFVSPFKKVNRYSVATEQAYLSRDKKEGSPDDDSFNIPTSDGKTVNVDLEFSYHFDSERLADTYTKFKGQSGSSIESTFIRGKMKAWTSEVSSTFSVLDIYGDKRAALNGAVLEHVKKKFYDYGIIIDSVNFSRIELDDQTSKAIQARINKQQELEALKIEQEKAKVESETKKQQAQIAAETKKIEAQAAAEAKLIEAQAEAKANKAVSDSLTDGLLKKMEMEARMQHGWVEINGANTIVKDK